MNILIAEDTPVLQLLNMRQMEHWGYDYDMASNGLEAIDYALKNEGKYDLGLMDIEMPMMNGLEATKVIRQRVKYFPIMAYTSNPDYRKRCFEYGFDEFVEKPTTSKDLRKIINELAVKAILLDYDKNDISIKQVTPMNPDDLKELRALKQKGLTKLKLMGTEHTFVVHRNIQNKISYDLIGEGKEMSEFIDRSEQEPGRCHLYKVNLHVTKDLFIPEELEDAIKKEDEIAIKFNQSADKKLPE